MISPDKSATSFLAKPEKPAKPQIIIPQRIEKNYAELLCKEPKGKIKHILIAQPQPEGPKSPYFDLAEKFIFSLYFSAKSK